MLLWMGASAFVSLSLVRSQTFVTQAAWATRMVEHHSTAVQTSAKLLERCTETTLCTLASSIVAAQAEEIEVLRNESPVALVSFWTAFATLLNV